MAKVVGVFVAHRGQDGDEGLRERVKAACKRTAPPDAGFRVVLGKEEHAASFSRCGSWEAWARHVATGIHPVTREPLYPLIVVPAGPVGRATAQILRFALAARRHVFVLAESGPDLTRVTGVEEDDGENWKGGWRVVTG